MNQRSTLVPAPHFNKIERLRVGFILLGIVVCFVFFDIDLTIARKSAYRDKAIFSSAAVFMILIMALSVLAVCTH